MKLAKKVFPSGGATPSGGVFSMFENIEKTLENKRIREQIFLSWDIFSFLYLRHYHISFIFFT